MYIHIYIYMSLCVCVCVCVYVYVCMYVCMYVCIEPESGLFLFQLAFQFSRNRPQTLLLQVLAAGFRAQCRYFTGLKKNIVCFLSMAEAARLR